MVKGKNSAEIRDDTITRLATELKELLEDKRGEAADTVAALEDSIAALEDLLYT